MQGKGDTPTPVPPVTPSPSPEPQPEDVLKLTIGSRTLIADWADNSSARALKELLAAGDITIHAHDYGGFEKVGPIGASLPTNDEPITTQAGDLILYQGTNFVLYYSQNTWNFTRLGRLRDVDSTQLRELLGTGDVDIILSIS